MNLYGVSGLGADHRVFKYLDLSPPIIPIKWIHPKKNETLESYASRLIDQIDTDEPYGFIGVSFGGLLTVELSKILKPSYVIQVSSAETHTELRRFYQILGQSKVLKVLPSFLFDPPRVLAHWLFNAKNKKLLNEILDDTDPNFAKWCVHALCSWKNKTTVQAPLLKIGSTSG